MRNVPEVGEVGCGGRNRTADLEVMSLTSYLCSTPRDRIKLTMNGDYNKSGM